MEYITKNHSKFLLMYHLKIVKTLKGHSTILLWKTFEKELKKEFWKEHTFWSDGYFVCSIGNVSEKTIRSYIDEQG